MLGLGGVRLVMGVTEGGVGSDAISSGYAACSVSTVASGGGSALVVCCGMRSVCSSSQWLWVWLFSSSPVLRASSGVSLRGISVATGVLMAMGSEKGFAAVVRPWMPGLGLPMCAHWSHYRGAL